MQAYFEPIPPDTVSSLREDLRPLMQQCGVDDFFNKCFAFSSVLEAQYPKEHEGMQEFIKKAKRVCFVHLSA